MIFQKPSTSSMIRTILQLQFRTILRISLGSDGKAAILVMDLERIGISSTGIMTSSAQGQIFPKDIRTTYRELLWSGKGYLKVVGQHSYVAIKEE